MKSVASPAFLKLEKPEVYNYHAADNGLAINMVNEVVEAGDDSMLVILNSGNLQYIRNGKIGNVFIRDSFCPVINQFIRCSNGDEYAIADEGLFKFEKDYFKRIQLCPGLHIKNAAKEEKCGNLPEHI